VLLAAATLPTFGMQDHALAGCDVFAGREAFECLETPGEVVDVDEVGDLARPKVGVAAQREPENIALT
jgi:hypothetical protein